MKYKYLLIVLALLLSVAINKAETKSPSSKTESIAMTAEADDYIDSMPEGMQDRLSDAVYHALEGQAEELQGFRKTANKSLYEIAADIKIEDKIIGGNRCKLYESKSSENSELPLFVYLPGGGMVIDGSSLGEGFCSALAQTGKMRVISVELPLMPENSFKQIEASFNNTLNALLEEQKESVIKNTSEICVGAEGASSRVLLDAFSDLDKKDIDGIKSMILYYPVFGINNGKSGSKKLYSRGYCFDYRVLESLMKAWTYAGAPDFVLDKTINFPPLMILSAERDIVFDEAEEFVLNINDAGIENEKIVLDGTIHGFLSDGNQKTAFRKAVALTESFICR